MASFHVAPLRGTSFGAHVTGLSLARLSEDEWKALHAAWLEYALLIFPAQHLDREAQVAFARRFGDLEFDIAPISNLKPDGSVRAEAEDDDVLKVLKGNMGWHADSTYMPVQAKGAVFSAEIVPPEGGETEWADMRAAYDALDPALRERVAGLSAYHSLRRSQARVGHVHRPDSAYSGYGFREGPDPLRPLVKVHPETGRRSLVIGRHAYAVPGLTPGEAEALLDELLDFACRPPRVHVHSWRPGDVVIWDNRCLLHRARPWDMKVPRQMWHSRIAGAPESEGAPA